MVSSSKNTPSHLPKRPCWQKSKMEKKAACSWLSRYHEFEFCFCGVFLLPLWGETRWFLVSVSCNKMVTLDSFFRFIEITLFFGITPFLLLFLCEQFCTRKCSLCQTLACTDRRSHKQKRLLLSDNKLLMKERDTCLRLCFSNPQFSETSKGPPQHIFAEDKGFRQNFAMTSPCFLQQKFCSMTKRIWNFCKVSVKSFLKLLLWTLNTIFWHRCKKFYQRGQNCFVRCPNLLNKNLFFLDSSSPMVLPDR